MPAGSSNGGADQPRFFRVAATSASPSGLPWVFSDPARLGAPWPITVWQSISVGQRDARALVIAAAIDSWSWPSMCSTLHPAAMNRSRWFVDVEREVFPSIVIELSSQKTISRLNRTAATSAIPIGMPGWPEFAFWTESIARTRIASAIVASTGLTAAIVSIVSSLFTAISFLRGALLALHELQDQRGQDE